MLLEIEDLKVQYPHAARPAVAGVSLSLGRGEAAGIVGASGSGKTQTALALLGLLPREARVTGSVRCDGVELLGQGEHVLNRFRARRVGMVFQDPAAALNPCLTVGQQLRLVLLKHRVVPRRGWRAAARRLLERVRLPDPDRALEAWPHQLSGGMRQRAMIALALAARPDVLVADEPTTALDVTVQAGILALLAELREQEGIALLLITHDLGVIAHNVDRLLVLEQGCPIETGPVREVFASPRHPHTRELIALAPRLDADGPPPLPDRDAPLLAIEGVTVSYARHRGHRRAPALFDVSLAVGRGETLAVVGESGAGKTTLARAITGLATPDAGRIALAGETLAPTLAERPPAIRRRVQMVFQDPVGSLNPAMTVRDILEEPLGVVGAAGGEEAVAALLERVRLDAALSTRRPHQLSGGQAQRVALARALAAGPAVLVCDEAVAALDGRARGRILDLLRAEQEATGLAVVFITHDLGVVRHIAHRVAVMYAGRIVELAGSDSLFRSPRHPYTRALLDAVPIPDPAAAPPAAAREAGAPPANGCAWQPRCPHADARCTAARPALERVDEDVLAACHRAGELDLSRRDPSR